MPCFYYGHLLYYIRISYDVHKSYHTVKVGCAGLESMHTFTRTSDLSAVVGFGLQVPRSTDKLRQQVRFLLPPGQVHSKLGLRVLF